MRICSLTVFVLLTIAQTISLLHVEWSPLAVARDCVVAVYHVLIFFKGESSCRFLHLTLAVLL